MKIMTLRNRLKLCKLYELGIGECMAISFLISFDPKPALEKVIFLCVLGSDGSIVTVPLPGALM